VQRRELRDDVPIHHRLYIYVPCSSPTNILEHKTRGSDYSYSHVELVLLAKYSTFTSQQAEWYLVDLDTLSTYTRVIIPYGRMSNFDPNAILRGAQLTLVGGEFALMYFPLGVIEEDNAYDKASSSTVAN